MKKLLLLSVLLMGVAQAGQIKTAVMLDDVTTVSTGNVFRPLGAAKTFHGIGSTSAGAGASVVEVEASMDNVNWVSLDTMSFTLATTVSSQTGTDNDAWKYLRGRVVSISGTDAKVSLFLGIAAVGASGP